MKTNNRLFLVVVGLLIPVQSARGQNKVVGHGTEQVIKVKKKPQRYLEAMPDGNWWLSVLGPARVAVGLRLVADGALPEEAVLAADLSNTGSSSTPFAPRKAKDASLSKSAKGEVLSQETVVVFQVPAGEHELMLWVHGADRPLLRLLPKPPPNAMTASAFVAKAPPAPLAVTESPVPPPAPPVSSPPSQPSPPTHVAPLPAAADSSSLALAPIVKDSTASGNAEVILATPAGEASSPSAVATLVAQRELQAEVQRDLFSLTAKVTAGIAVPQAITKLDTAMVYTVGVGYLLPLFAQRIEVWLDGTYNQASRRSSADDARLLTGDSFDYTIVERELLIGLGGLYRFKSPQEGGLNYFGRLGVRVDFQRSDVHGAVGTTGFGSNTETKSEVGVIAGGGLEYAFGPGAFLAQLDFAFADLSHRTTGNTSAGGPGISVGYHFAF
jgi:hypothetical protein